MRRPRVFSGVLLAAVLAVVGSVPVSAQAASEASHWSGPVRVFPREVHRVRALDCATPTACVAVDETGQALTFDGHQWSRPVGAARDRGELTSISCPTTRLCAAVGGPRFAWRTRTGWHLRITGLDLDSVSCASASFCLAASRGGRTTTFRGGRWHRGPSLRLKPHVHVASGVSCASRRFCLAVDSRGVTHRFTGRTWVTRKTPGARPVPGYGSLECVSGSFCLMSVPGGVWRWNGHRWRHRSFDGTAGFDSSVSCSSDRFCLVTYSYGVAMTWDGRWHRAADVPDGSQVRRAPLASCSGARRCTVVLADLPAVWRYADGWHPRAAYPMRPVGMAGLACPTVSFCLALDDHGGGRAYMDGRWQQISVPDGDVRGASLSCPSAGFCMAVVPSSGDASTWDGSGWSTPTHLGAPGYWHVDCGSPESCVAVLNDDTFTSGTTYVWSAGTWAAPLGGGEAVLSLSCPAPGDCWGGEDEGWIAHFDGTAWTAQSIGSAVPVDAENQSRLSVSCPTTTFCAAVDSVGNVAFLRDGRWGLRHRARATGGFTCASERSCTSGPRVYHQREVSRWNGSTWSTARALPPGYSPPGGASLSCPTAAVCVVLDATGNAYRRH